MSLSPVFKRQVKLAILRLWFKLAKNLFSFGYALSVSDRIEELDLEDKPLYLNGRIFSLEKAPVWVQKMHDTNRASFNKLKRNNLNQVRRREEASVKEILQAGQAILLPADEDRDQLAADAVTYGCAPGLVPLAKALHLEQSLTRQNAAAYQLFTNSQALQKTMTARHEYCKGEAAKFPHNIAIQISVSESGHKLLEATNKVVQATQYLEACGEDLRRASENVKRITNGEEPVVNSLYERPAFGDGASGLGADGSSAKFEGVLL